MTSIQQRAELHRQIWQIANDVRGSVDGWDFKQYVLGALFYRFISENFSSYIEAGDDSICYAKLDDSVITDDIKDDAIKTKGYYENATVPLHHIATSGDYNWGTGANNHRFAFLITDEDIDSWIKYKQERNLFRINCPQAD